MFDPTELTEIQEALGSLVSGLDPDAVPLEVATAVFTAFDELVRISTAGRTLMARKVEESRAWQAAGHRDAAEFLAARTGSSLGAAKDELKTSQAIKELPATRAAIATGQVSAAQGATIADAAKVNPSAESDLLGRAGRENLNELRASAGRAKAAADPDPDASHRRIHSERRLSRWTDGEGAYNLKLRCTAEQGAAINGVIDPIVDELYRQRRTTEERDGRDTMACDALVEACRRASSGGKETTKNPNPRFLGLLRVDLEALHRGWVQGEELCEITGIGPVPVEVAKGLLGEATLKLVITKGVDVVHVTSLGRGPTAAMKVALAWTQPTCTAQGCSRTYVEYDHAHGVEWVKTEHTRLDETDPLCSIDHRLKTHHGWALVPGKGKRPFVPPDDPRHPDRCGPPGIPDPAATRRAVAQRVAAELEARLAHTEPVPATLFA